MLNKIKAIWRIITNRSYVVMTEDGITASIPNNDTPNYMRTLVEGYEEIMNKKGDLI